MFSIAHNLLYISTIINFIALSHGQLQVLKYIPRGAVDDELVSSAQFVGENIPNTGNQFQNADRICVYGIWALYSTIDYGLGQEASTTVISAVGKNPYKLECSSSGQISGLTQVKSARYFGNRNTSEIGISIISDAYLLGGRWDVIKTSSLIDEDTTDISGVRIGSVAVTGNSSWQICSDVDCNYQICVDASKGRNGIFYLNRNTVKDTASKWPLVAKNVQSVTQTECAKISNPIYPRSQWRTDLETKSGLDFHEWSPAENYSVLSDDDIDSITTTVIP